MWLVLSMSLLTAGPSPPPADCELRLRNGRYEGSCGSLPGGVASFKLLGADSIASGVWRADAKPMTVWRGEMTFAADRGSWIEVETYTDGTGVLRTEGGWFPISQFQRSIETIRFRVDPTQRVPPSDLDRQIIQRAAAILSTEGKWDRADDRVCAATDTTWSIYCALQRATIEVTGGFHHRRPALEVVRMIVEQRTAGRNYSHRLMDYNNDKTTRLEDVRSLFADAVRKIPP